ICHQNRCGNCHLEEVVEHSLCVPTCKTSSCLCEYSGEVYECRENMKSANRKHDF
uniref:Uncharacterized protein n=1 Tax=Petromyzon marinus TaxID=7757 RepID=S4RJ39_PETMA